MWALSYCERQGALHIASLQQEVAAAMRGVLEGGPSYIIIFVSDDKEAVHAKADELRDTLCRPKADDLIATLEKIKNEIVVSDFDYSKSIEVDRLDLVIDWLKEKSDAPS